MPRPHAIPHALLALALVAGTVAAAPAGAPAGGGPAKPAGLSAARSATPAKATAKGRAPAVSRAPAAGGWAARDSVAAAPASRAPAKGGSGASDSSMTLRGGQEGTVFKTRTLEGEDRVHVDFERPGLDLDLDPTKVPGLDIGTARDVLDRTLPDLVTPMLAVSTADASPYVARPWLTQFGTGSVVRFHPETRDVERWKLIIVDSRGQTVRTYQGRGKPPEELAWDGRTDAGSTAVPGLTYSYAFEAHDKAGNKRNLVGPGFGVSAFAFDSPSGPVLTFSGRMLDADGRRGGADAPSLIVLEAASRISQGPAATRPLKVTATARSREQADALAARVVRELAGLTPGDPARLMAQSQVETDAPEDGVVRIAPAGKP